MNKMGGVITMLVGLVVIALAVFDVMQGGGATPDMKIGGWPPVRQAVFSLGAVISLAGCYMVVKKPAKKK